MTAGTVYNQWQEWSWANFTWHFALFSSNRVKAWKFFAGMFGAFFKQINALHGKENTMQLQAQYGTQIFVHQA